MAELEGLRRACKDMTGQEVMIWTAGGHYFRGELGEITDDGLMVVRNVSCTLAGDRHERDMVLVSVSSIDAIS